MPRIQESGKQAFVVAPFPTDTKRQVGEKHTMQRKLKPFLVQAKKDINGIGGIAKVFESLGVAQRKKFGLVLDLDVLTSITPSDPAGQLLSTVFQLYQAVDAKESRKAHLESLQLIRQLRTLGHDVSIRDLGDSRHERFIRAAVRAGAVRVPAGAEDARKHAELQSMLSGVYDGTTWARDFHVKIDGVLEKPSTDFMSLISGKKHFFGEGGSMVQVAPKKWCIAQTILLDPRIKSYERKGHEFHPMPDAIQYDPTLSELMDEPIYNSVPHIDFVLGAVPERCIVAVDPHYLSEHRQTVERVKRLFGLTVVEVPKEEANRHPANMLALGEGRVLVDSGAPEFIKRLRSAGVEVVPTAVPLNAMLVNKGGLHCLFNEI